VELQSLFTTSDCGSRKEPVSMPLLLTNPLGCTAEAATARLSSNALDNMALFYQLPIIRVRNDK
jgi:hypothetical protein